MIKNINSLKFISIVIFFCMNSIACNYTMRDAEKYLPGQYYYEIPSGEVQVLIINPDFTFKQIVYSSNKKDTLYQNTGEMDVNGHNIEFWHWLECYELAYQKLLIKPEIVHSIGSYWRKSRKNGEVSIVKFDQTNYIFKKKYPNSSK